MFTPGVDSGFFLEGGAPLRNDVTDGEVKKKIKSEIRTYEEKNLHLRGRRGEGCAPPAPFP